MNNKNNESNTLVTQQNSPIIEVPLTPLNPCAMIYVSLPKNSVLNPCAVEFLYKNKSVNENGSQNMSISFISNFNQDAKPFFPPYVKRDGIRVLSVILFMLLMLKIMIFTLLKKKQNLDDFPPGERLKTLKRSNPQNLILGHLNINSIRYKFEFLKSVIGNNVDLLLISETKINDTFPEG